MSTTVYRAGLVVLGVLAVADLASPLLTDGETPPMSIALIGSALGLLSLILIALAWRGRLTAAIGAIVLRLLSARTAVPAFLFDGVPTIAKMLAGIAIALAVVGTTLVLVGYRRAVATVTA